MHTADDCPPGEELLMFADGYLGVDRRAAVEAHLRRCASCRDTLAFTQGLEGALRGTIAVPQSAAEPCPSSWTLVLYQEGELADETARHVRAHLSFCDDCFTEVLALERVGEGETQDLRLVAEGDPTWHVPVTAVDSQGMQERLELEVLYGPALSPQGHFSLDLQVPVEQSFEGRAVLVTFRLGGQIVELRSRVERSVISIDHALESGFQGTIRSEEERQALLQGLEISIL